MIHGALKLTMINEETKIRDSYSDQIDLLRNFVWQLMHYRALKTTFNNFDQGFWRLIYSNFFDMAVLEWCKLFGANAEPSHWKKVFADKEDFIKYILGSVNMSSHDWKGYWTKLTDYRNQNISHFNPNFKPDFYPELEPALISVMAYYEYLIKKMDQYSIEHYLPSSLRAYSLELYKQALIYSKKASYATDKLDEQFK
jgi:hypothetical protein